jgi:pimeloyl-ACP methyl ester carboxylesterase
MYSTLWTSLSVVRACGRYRFLGDPRQFERDRSTVVMSDTHRRPGTTPPPPPDLGEFAALWEFPRLALHAPRLLTAPRGKGEPVVLLPGFRANDVSTSALRGYLATLGYRAVGWGLGTNDGDIERLVSRVANTLQEMVLRRGRPAALVGQSLGGYVAREIARDHGELVAQVITFGTPMLSPRSARPIRCPVTVIYSKADRIVPWRRCIDPDPAANNIEVRSTHLGMGFDPDVWDAIARQLHRGSVGA